MHHARWIVSLALAAALLGVVSCDDGGSGAASKDQAAAPELSGAPVWVLASAPAGARGVVEVKASAQEGDEVVLRGRIGGRKEPLTPGSPVFTVIDLALPSCRENPADSCRTPWDYCCETQELITANAATVQIVDAQGQPAQGSPADHGFAPLDEVIIVGVVGARPDDRVLMVKARGVYRIQ